MNLDEINLLWVKLRAALEDVKKQPNVAHQQTEEEEHATVVLLEHMHVDAWKRVCAGADPLLLAGHFRTLQVHVGDAYEGLDERMGSEIGLQSVRCVLEAIMEAIVMPSEETTLGEDRPPDSVRDGLVLPSLPNDMLSKIGGHLRLLKEAQAFAMTCHGILAAYNKTVAAAHTRLMLRCKIEHASVLNTALLLCSLMPGVRHQPPGLCWAKFAGAGAWGVSRLDAVVLRQRDVVSAQKQVGEAVNYLKDVSRDCKKPGAVAEGLETQERLDWLIEQKLVNVQEVEKTMNSEGTVREWQESIGGRLPPGVTRWHTDLTPACSPLSANQRELTERPNAFMRCFNCCPLFPGR